LADSSKRINARGVKTSEDKEDLKSKILECLRMSSKFPSDTEKVACFVACVNEALKERGARLIVTGGFGVELFTGASYRTADVDLKTDGSVDTLRDLEEALNEIGERPGREWIVSGLTKAIDLLPPGAEGFVEVRTPCGVLYVEKPESLLIRYLAAWKFWDSKEDRDKAVALMFALEDLLDWGEVEALAKKEGVEDKLRELREWLSSWRS